MKKTEELRNDIYMALERINSMDKSERIEVFNIYKVIYEKYLALKKRAFDDEYLYKLYLKSRLIKDAVIQIELKSLLDNNDDDCVTDNFFQIKASILSFSFGLTKDN